MRLILIRHGETDWNTEKRIQGSQDIPLNSRGERQVEEIAAFFADSRLFVFSRVVTSPLQRAKQSALICSQYIDIPCEVVPEFRERHFGKLEGVPLEEVRTKYQISDLEKVSDAKYEMEPLASVKSRVQHGLKRLQANYQQETILLVTHGSIIKLIAREYGMEVEFVNNATYIELQQADLDAK
jgi:broad specificity phosphatase PhoE